tara:strand:+ start:28155 stop:28604 length:450 start_codon:yes stop_codon:yes gene_type:complete
LQSAFGFASPKNRSIRNKNRNAKNEKGFRWSSGLQTSCLVAARVAMDAVYRALDGSSTRVVLSETARRRKDRDAQKRARRKGYAAGLTCAVLDAWWREATDTGSGGRGTQGQLPGDATMSPEQAKAFFSRTGLPNGKRRREMQGLKTQA